MLPKTQKVVSPKEFDKRFKQEALIAEFSTPKEEDDYERRDATLIRLIRKEIREHWPRLISGGIAGAERVKLFEGLQ